MSQSITETKPKSPAALIQPDGAVSISFSIRYEDLIFDKEKPLGEGAYGKVYKGEWDFNTVAIKEYTAQDFSEKTKREILNEMSVMANAIQSAHLVRPIGMSLEKPHYCLVMEYMSGGDLYHYLHSELEDIPWNTRYRIGLA
jgi:serine/threonine protein kinase